MSLCHSSRVDRRLYATWIFAKDIVPQARITSPSSNITCRSRMAPRDIFYISNFSLEGKVQGVVGHNTDEVLILVYFKCGGEIAAGIDDAFPLEVRGDHKILFLDIWGLIHE